MRSDRWLAGCALVLLAGSAWAADYTVTRPSNQYQAPPGSATNLNLHALGQNTGGKTITLPFAFRYFGKSYETAWVSRDGYLQFGASSPPPWDQYGTYSNQ